MGVAREGSNPSIDTSFLLSASHVLEVMAVAESELLSLEQAAELLNVRLSFLSRLLQEGNLRSVHGTDGLLRIPKSEVLRFKAKQDADRKAALSELIRVSVVLGLYDVC